MLSSGADTAPKELARRRKDPRTAYATKAQVVRLLQAAREAGIDIGGVEVSPEGAIKVLTSNRQAVGDLTATNAASAYDAWKQATSA